MPARIDIAEIQRAALRSIPLTFRLTSLPHESHALLDRILEIYLVELGQERILEPLSYCIRELIVNAQKANTKRLYFEEKGLDIARDADYQKGMPGFRRELTARIEHWLAQLRARKLFISVTFHTTGGNLAILVRNSAELTSHEQSRIYDRIARARAHHSFVEALAGPLDSLEGAGLGILILLEFLKRIGLGEEAFSIQARNGMTIASVMIPMSSIHLEKIMVLTEAIARDVDSLPHFPEAVVKLIRLTEDPKASVAKISASIATDPSLTADLLKLVNSASYMLPRRVDNILQGVTIVGMKGLRNLLYTYGAQKILKEQYAEMKALWEHSNRVAYYAFLLARSLKSERNLLDDVYVSGILHDLGQIIVRWLHPEAMEKMRNFCREKDIPPRILERFSFGLNHAEIGALIAQKWNFPDQLVYGIKHHHDPLAAPVRYKKVVFIVYLASALSDLERGYVDFEQLEKPVLSELGIDSEEKLTKILDRLHGLFEQRKVSF
ncbi:MAG TPA: HDOD domain-containing protein [Spirochaetia bacterium]|nr:HDOD domain-containing protein [Spirochaetia bacterium]